ncbi:MAG: membrane lipoprotein lipid attachment site-containing protein [Cereibacter changlensis]|jgi:outer membrane lipoprotein SlyB|uniref:Type IV secretion system putative lipoprotein virB7 n=2 Tax=Cereibacter changlensis TaxID=402884 RepID=A0A2T4JNY8_9RHOB|nr:membrane lipoprotein lipid attachment site-containing protein [Cereibacter changlensis]MBZ4690725.1 hypothetical protein [Cereibacter sp.]PTE19611.1 hypothetical protein C5F48_21995 [Cereibacter changlensis JA139]PZX52263.1 YmgG-like glycine-zipper protein [Cereibacter changlensis]TKA98225.1 glycine zipper 2TM domain-containing protein [Cereibacter changlensis]
MKKIFLALPIMAVLAGCETPNQNQAAGALTGAALGAAVSGDDDRLTGAAVGAATGAIAGSLIGQNSNGQCTYRNARGQTFYGPC